MDWLKRGDVGGDLCPRRMIRSMVVQTFGYTGCSEVTSGAIQGGRNRRRGQGMEIGRTGTGWPSLEGTRDTRILQKTGSQGG